MRVGIKFVVSDFFKRSISIFGSVVAGARKKYPFTEPLAHVF